MTREIRLARGCVAIVDDDMYDFLTQWKWYYCGDGYAAREVTTNGKTHTIWMHRVVTNAPEDQRVDHIDRNPLNNIRSNLRLATQAENCRNHGPRHRAGKTSQYKGVSLHHNRWRAEIQINGQRIRTTVFDLEIDAARAYDQLARKHFGTFAYLNFPQEVSDDWPS